PVAALRAAAVSPDDDALALAAVLAQLEKQRGISPGAAASLLADDVAAGGPLAPAPPSRVYRDARLVCDLDGDGARDLVSNTLDLGRAPRLTRATVNVEAFSGATGERLWRFDNGVLVPLLGPYDRQGDPSPKAPDNVQRAPDVDGDGVCDLFAFNFSTEDVIQAPPFLPMASVAFYETGVHAISGRDGTDVWATTLSATRVQAQPDPFFGTADVTAVLGFPTGFLAYDSPNGPRLALKLTDVRREAVEDGLGITTLVPLFRDPVHENHVKYVETVRVLDATTGELRWERVLGDPSLADPGSDLPTESQQRTTNVSWFTGVAQLAGDEEPEIVLDQYQETSPNGNEYQDPVTGEIRLRYGRGMSVTTLKGEDGGTLWSATVVPTEPVEPNVENEENHETMVWTAGQIVGDLDGDGLADPVASWLAQEEAMGTTINGAFRTHFVALSGATGETRWDVAQQGWGVVQTLTGPDAERPLLGFGMVDLPSRPPAGGRFPPKFVREGAMDARDGTVLWSYQKQFASNSYLSFNLALLQYREALAPVDVDGDGALDLLTPAQYGSPTGADQVLLATSNHTYEIRSAADGRLLRAFRAWGPDGRAVACGDGAITVLSGHSRRLDWTRFDAHTGERLWRVPFHNDPAPRAATRGLDLTALGAACADDEATGRTLLVANLQAFSFDRRHEVVSVFGSVANGTASWMAPQLRGNPPSEALFQASIALDEKPAPMWPGLVVGALLGVAAGVGLLALATRRRAFPRLLGAGMVLLTLAPSALALGIGAPAALDALPGTPEVASGGAAVPPSAASLAEAVLRETRAAGPDATPKERVEAVTRALVAAGVTQAPAADADTNQTLAAFEDNNTVSFSYPLGDVSGDGVDDLALDQFCYDEDSCYWGGIELSAEGARKYLLNETCSRRHTLYGVDGRDGTILWSRGMDVFGTPLLSAHCGAQYVVGVAPGPKGPAMLVYRYEALRASIQARVVNYTHELTLVDAATGADLWTHRETGSTVGTMGYQGYYEASSNLVLNPMLVASSQGIGRPRAQPALLVQGVGYQYVAQWQGQPPVDLGYNGPFRLVDSYQPDERLTRLDLATGAVLWTTAAFEPTQDRSVFPSVATTAPFPLVMSGVPAAVSERYWDPPGCCGDLTGDGVADVVYRTVEWSRTPSSNPEGPYFWSMRVVAFDGATGQRYAEREYLADLDSALCGQSCRRPWDPSTRLAWPAYDASFQPIGDANGDGAGDLVQQEVQRVDPAVYTYSVLDGKTLSPLWSFQTLRNARIFPIGDADADGGHDFVLVDWYGFEGNGDKEDDYATPGATPVTAYSGATGARLWRVVTYAAPADVVEAFSNLARNGVPDLDGDGVGDLFVDEPQYLDDQTVFHHLTFVSGRDGSPIGKVRAVGAFAFPARAGDLDGDGRDEVALVSGDVNDLWITLLDGATAEAQWSRRLLALPASSYAFALPRLRFHELVGEDGRLALTVNLHLVVQTLTIFPVADADGSADVVRTATGITPQILHLNATRGDYDWALPEIDGVQARAFIAGGTPGVQAYERVLAAQAAPMPERAAREEPALVAGVAAFAAALVLTLVAGVAYARAYRTDPEVPLLE
ncbi:MAG TPA: hypothetical protein VHH36_02635, partial [Candidatus Thermoplasmatota archaeon]|nr:hypothetical protein [Candidatus Thermoplasmatota archaeon]